ncbi:MAG: hypothetical protein FWG56_06170 [Desulfovibrionaceae bacterium]|nr:hypothetical protein [Desulfovibrionaceae bacterium]
MTNAIVTVQGEVSAPPTLLGQGPARIPTGGKIHPGIMVLTKRAAEVPGAREIYQQGVADGHSFEQIGRTLKEALPQLKSPLAPRNLPWFTVRAQDFPNPEVARQILDAYGEDRGRGRRLYRFPVVFPSDRWQSVMPHELAVWGVHEKRFWSQYAPDGRTRHCVCHAPVPMDHTGRRAIRIFGGRKTMLREDNGGVCDPDRCPQYQARQCNLSGRFLFFIPGIRTINALELPTTSFYALSNAIQRFQIIAHMRGGRISGFLGRSGETFFLTKALREVTHVDENGRAVRVAQWIIELEAPVDVTALLRDGEDAETAIVQATMAGQALEDRQPVDGGENAGAACAGGPEGVAQEGEPPVRPGYPTLAQLLGRAEAMGLDTEQFQQYAERRWGSGWKIERHGRGRVWDEMERYANDPEGFADKINCAMDEMAGRA